MSAERSVRSSLGDGTQGGEAAQRAALRFLTRHAGWLLALVVIGAFWIRFYGLDRIVEVNQDEVNPLLAGFRLTQSRFLPG
ncbi:MAG: hypothetical protein ACE5JS_23470, partial [Nitrospinota bacterium]